MKRFRDTTILVCIILIIIALLLFYAKDSQPACLTGAFLADQPTKEDIINFKKKYGKKPYLVMIFTDWNRFVSEQVIEAVYSSGCVLFISWEPWYAASKKGIDYDELLSGKWDSYISNFADKLKDIENIVYIRFAHEMNGNWYPWSGSKIGRDKFVAIYRYVKDIFDRTNVTNLKWVFSLNWEDVPREDNHFMLYYPGDKYVDYLGIDGYNWGNTRAWSKWRSFEAIFKKRYKEITTGLKKPILISEFSSTSSGGDKSRWIKEAMNSIKHMKKIKGFVLFNVDKETDWSFSTDNASGQELKRQLKDSYFRDGE